MTKEKLFELHQSLCESGLELMRKKNADYSRDGALGNFFVCETLQCAKAEMGILVRVSDKLSRLSSILQSEDGPKVADESAEDTIVDVINYMVLLKAVLVEKSGTHSVFEKPQSEFCTVEYCSRKAIWRNNVGLYFCPEHQGGVVDEHSRTQGG